MKIYLIRHGETDWNVEGRITGEKDIPLNELGQKQAQTAADILKDKDIKKIFSSPVLRCFATAEIISKAVNCPIVKDKRWREIDFGNWAGKIYHDLRKNPDFKSYYKYFSKRIIPKGEKFIDVQKRVVKALEDIIKTENESVAVVTHADPIKLVICHILGLKPSMAAKLLINNASIICLDMKKASLGCTKISLS